MLAPSRGAISQKVMGVESMTEHYICERSEKHEGIEIGCCFFPSGCIRRWVVGTKCVIYLV